MVSFPKIPKIALFGLGLVGVLGGYFVIQSFFNRKVNNAEQYILSTPTAQSQNYKKTDLEISVDLNDTFGPLCNAPSLSPAASSALYQILATEPNIGNYFASDFHAAYRAHDGDFEQYYPERLVTEGQRDAWNTLRVGFVGASSYGAVNQEIFTEYWEAFFADYNTDVAITLDELCERSPTPFEIKLGTQ